MWENLAQEKTAEQEEILLLTEKFRDTLKTCKKSRLTAADLSNFKAKRGIEAVCVCGSCILLSKTEKPQKGTRDKKSRETRKWRRTDGIKLVVMYWSEAQPTYIREIIQSNPEKHQIYWLYCIRTSLLVYTKNAFAEIAVLLELKSSQIDSQSHMWQQYLFVALSRTHASHNCTAVLHNQGRRQATNRVPRRKGPERVPARSLSDTIGVFHPERPNICSRSSEVSICAWKKMASILRRITLKFGTAPEY